MLAGEDRLDFLHHLRIRRGDIIRFGRVRREVVKLQGEIGLHPLLLQVRAEALPALAEPESLLSPVTRKLAVEKGAWACVSPSREVGARLMPSMPLGTAAVEPVSSARVGSQSSKPVTRSLVEPAGSSRARRRSAETRMPPSWSSPFNPRRSPTLLKNLNRPRPRDGSCRCPTRNDEGPPGDAQFRDEIDDLADVGVELRDHRRVGRARREVGSVTALFTREGRIVPLQREVGSRSSSGTCRATWGRMFG